LGSISEDANNPGRAERRAFAATSSDGGSAGFMVRSSFGKCGQQTTVIGYDESEVLNVKPAEYYVEIARAMMCGCPTHS
jgi:hypothetical protein